MSSINIEDYPIKLIVAGSREFYDKQFFHTELLKYLSQFKKPVLFISGAAPTGADRLIIDWCKHFNKPYKEMPADWSKYNKKAGYIRNVEMAKVATHLLAYWNGNSKGTKHMLDIGQEYKLPTTIINISTFTLTKL